MDETSKAEITDQILEAVSELAPDATFRSMYGGTVIEMRKGDPKSLIGGVFVYAGYVSLEFTRGVYLDDPDGVLEGSGKLRRHIKFYSMEDLTTKTCQRFVRQAVADFEKL